MKISLRGLCTCGVFFISFILSNNLEGNRRSYYKGFHTTKAIKNLKKSHTPKINLSHKINTTKKISFNKKLWQIVKILCICPMKYEYNGVCEKLKIYKCSQKQRNDFYLDELCQYVSLDPKEVEFFRINNQIMCLVFGNKREHSVSFLLGSIMSTLQNLQFVIIGGICGCSNINIPLYSVMIPSQFYSLDSLSICNVLNNGQLQQRKGEKIGAIYEKYALNTEGFIKINLENEIRRLLKANNCIDFTSSCFIDNEEFCIKLVENFKQEENEKFAYLPHIFEMEDYAIVQACLTKKVPFICLRIVSDHAGLVENEKSSKDNISSNAIDESKIKASKKLGKTIKTLIDNIDFSSIITFR